MPVHCCLLPAVSCRLAVSRRTRPRHLQPCTSADVMRSSQQLPPTCSAPHVCPCRQLHQAPGSCSNGTALTAPGLPYYTGPAAGSPPASYLAAHAPSRLPQRCIAVGLCPRHEGLLRCLHVGGLALPCLERRGLQGAPVGEGQVPGPEPAPGTRRGAVGVVQTWCCHEVCCVRRAVSSPAPR